MKAVADELVIFMGILQYREPRAFSFHSPVYKKAVLIQAKCYGFRRIRQRQFRSVMG